MVARKIGLVQFPTSERRIHFLEWNLDFLPLCVGGKCGDVGIVITGIGFDSELIFPPVSFHFQHHGGSPIDGGIIQFMAHR